MFDANILTKGGKRSSIQNLVDKKIEEKITSSFGKKVANKVAGIMGENAEEIVEDNIDNLIDKVVNNKDMPGFKEWLSNTSETIQATTISTIILDLLGFGGTNYEEVQKDEQAQKYIKKARQIIKENNLANVYDENELKNFLIDMKKSENQNTDNKVTNQQTKIVQNEISKQIDPEQRDNAQIQQPSGVLPTKSNINYTYEKSSNTKIDNFRRDASTYWNNTDRTRSLVTTIEKVITDKNYNVRLDDKITNSNGQSVNAQIKTLENGEVEIKINPNSQRVGEFLLMHEITHAIETQEIKDLIIDHASKNQDFNQELESLKQTYGTDEVSSEVVADISGQLLGNQEFINNLSMEKPSVFRRIYNKIIELANKITGNSNEALFMKDLKNKWEKAYRTQNNNLQEDTQYSIGGMKGINNALKKNTNYRIAEQYYNKALKMAEQNIDNETIRKQTNWFQDKNGDWKFEFSDKDMSLKNIKFKEGKTYKLGDILEHDMLFTLYPELAEYDVIFENIKNGGAFYRNKHLIKLNSSKMNSKISSQGTLIHEIQHAIQQIEGFGGGARVKRSRLAYYNSLGEIEANDTKRRYIKEKQGKLNRTLVAPESSKSNPQHPSLNNYLQNRSMIDKMKDSVYNYFNSKNNGGISYEINEENLEQDNEKNSKDVLQTRGEDAGQIWDRLGSERRGYLNDRESSGFNQETEKQSSEQDSGLVDGRGYGDRRGRFVNEESKINSGSFSVDNKGRELSKEQQEYFKNSKVRNEKGDLKVLYHGTDAEFNVFDYKYLGKNGTSLGKGFYLTDDINTAKGYAERGTGHIMEVYANIEKPLSYGKTTITSNEYIKFIEAVNEATDGQLLGDYSDGEKIKKGNAQYKEMLDQFREDYKYGGDDIDLVSEILNSANLSLKNGYKILKETLGYDGIISNKGFLTDDGTVYVPFLSEQIKNVDNTNPTDNPDIRYSNNNSNWQQYLEKNFPAKGTRTNLQDIKLYNQDTKNAKNGNMKQINTNEQQERTLKNKAQKYIQRNKRFFIDNITKSFQTSYYANKELLNTTMDNIVNEIAQNGYISNEKSSEIFEDLYSKMVKIDTDYYDQYKNVKNEIRNIKFYVPDKVKNSIADYNDFRLSNMGNVILTNDPSNINIDTKYQELSRRYPELFPDNIIEPSEQLERIAEVQKDIAKVETNVKAYMDKNMGPDYKLWAKNDFEQELDKFIDEIKLAYRYNNDSKENFNRLTVSELKDKYNQIPNLRRNYEKVLNTEVLTEKDRVQVDRLLKGEISLDELPKDTNKKGIRKVYEAKLQYQSILDEIKENKKEIKESMKSKATEIMGDLSKWKDKKVGWLYSRETAGRNFYDVAPKDVADKINKEYVEKYYNNEAEAIRTINKYTEQINDLDLSSRKKYKATYSIQELVDGKLQDKVVSNKVSEAELVQLFGESRITYDQLQDTGVDTEKIINSANTIRKIYDTLLDDVNTTLLENGFEPVSKRRDYFPHFTEGKDSILTKVSKMIGIDLTGEELPTDIAGRSQNFKPDKKYVANFNERNTDITDFNVLKGFDSYIRNVTDVIYHTNDIMNYRALSDSIREFYNTKEIKSKIQDIQESNELTEEEKFEKIIEIKESTANKSNLSNFINWLDNYINILAGKKTINDRPMEKELSRKMYQCMSKVESRVSTNMVGGNIGVAVSNIGVLAQATAEIRTDNLLLGMAGTLWNNGKSILGKQDNSFASESNFITRRRGSDTTYVSNLDKLMAPINNSLNAIDDVVSESIVRGKYIQNLREGMTQQEALENADRYAAGLMADRSKGALPTQFYSKNPFAKMVNMFQVEVNNQYSHFAKDIPRDLNGNKLNLAYSYSKAMIASYFMNELLSVVRGNSTRLLPDPIYIIKDLIHGLTDDDDDNDWETVVGIGEEILGNLPFVSVPVSLFGSSLGIDTDNIGRIPFSGAFPNINKIGSALTNKDATSNYKLQTVKKELEKPFYNFLLPVGGAQLNKTKEAVKTMIKGKSSTVDTNGNELIQFPVENTSTIQKVQAGVFGKYALPLAKDYTDSGYKSLNAKQTKIYKESNLPHKELLQYIDQGLKKNEDKIDYISSQKMNEQQKWGIYKYDIFSSTEREDGGSQLKDAEYITSHGVSKNEYIKLYNKAQKNNIDMPTADEYKEMKSKNISLNTYINYKTSIKEQLNAKKKSGELDEKGQLKDKDKIDVLLKGNYTNAEKKSLYENYIGTEDDLYSKALSKNNIDITSYLKYKIDTSNISADKDEDGKSISGSSKKKYYDYVNKNITGYANRLLILGSKYKLSDTERKALADYVYKNYSKKDLIGVYEQLDKNFTIKNGKVYYK